MKYLVMLSVVLILSGCAGTESNINLVSLGMNKAQVQDVMGSPKSSSAQAGLEYFIYGLTSKGNAGECVAGAVLTLGFGFLMCGGEEDDFFVRFKEGVVESYGRVGDFDSTNVPEATINVNTN